MTPLFTLVVHALFHKLVEPAPLNALHLGFGSTPHCLFHLLGQLLLTQVNNGHRSVGASGDEVAALVTRGSAALVRNKQLFYRRPVVAVEDRDRWTLRLVAVFVEHLQDKDASVGSTHDIHGHLVVNGAN